MKSRNVDFVSQEIQRILRDVLRGADLEPHTQDVIRKAVARGVQDEYKYLLRGPAEPKKKAKKAVKPVVALDLCGKFHVGQHVKLADEWRAVSGAPLRV